MPSSFIWVVVVIDVKSDIGSGDVVAPCTYNEAEGGANDIEVDRIRAQV